MALRHEMPFPRGMSPSWKKSPFALLLLLTGAAGAACGSEVGGTDTPEVDGGVGPDGSVLPDGGPVIPPLTDERPWEVVSDQGETYLPNTFYADASQNEQVMPTALDGRYMIDRLVYPTIGNPNLYVKEDASDSFMTVLRLEPSTIAHLAPKRDRNVPGTTRSYLDLTEDKLNRISIFLVPRDGRQTYTEYGSPVPGVDNKTIFRLEGAEYQVNEEPADMPASLKVRSTVRAIFRKDQMKDIPAGLYDIRVEVKKAGDLVPTASGGLVEWQYNALRVFDKAPDSQYQVINVTDTQVSIGNEYSAKTKSRLEDFVSWVNTSQDAEVKDAAFITFNGDLHNGGSPFTLLQKGVSHTYNSEAKAILNAIKWLKHPIFLTIGNHDGYGSTGIAPDIVRQGESAIGTSINEIVGAAYPRAWPSFDQNAWQSYLTSIKQTPGGRPLDLFTGSFVRRAGAKTFTEGWREVPRDQRNMLLYDGFNQWKRTYGPTYSSFRFGRNVYVNMNSFEIRQHRRTGWGMYTVNYGGGMSEEQLEWAAREVKKAPSDDVILLSHHDPRGGHNGKDLGFFFSPLSYNGISQSTFNYLKGEVWNPQVCKLPSWAQSGNQELLCIHDGLQEWMGPDQDFDCRDDEKKNGRCDLNLFTEGKTHYYRFSAYQLIDLIAKNANVRTYLLGHTHYNSLEVRVPNDELAPVVLDPKVLTDYATLEVENPTRGYAWLTEQGGAAPGGNGNYDPEAVKLAAIQARLNALQKMYEGAGKQYVQKLANHELIYLRTTSNADLTSQKYGNDPMLGFSVLTLKTKADARGFSVPQINEITYFRNLNNGFGKVPQKVSIDRTKHLEIREAANPVVKLFTGF